MEQEYREVDFHKYCATCEYKEQPENEWICDECLHNPINLYSDKPVNWKEKNRKE